MSNDKSMSRIGNQPVILAEGVTARVRDSGITVSGPKGELSLSLDSRLTVKVGDGKIAVSRQEDSKDVRSLHGLTRTLIDNLAQGVSRGWSKTLKIVGTGFRASLEGGALVLHLGFSHPVKVEPPVGINFELEGKDGLKVSGIDKVLVGETAARIRRLRPPEPYKGKGIRYADEAVRRKAGKAAKTGAAAGAAG